MDGWTAIDVSNPVTAGDVGCWWWAVLIVAGVGRWAGLVVINEEGSALCSVFFFSLVGFGRLGFLPCRRRGLFIFSELIPPALVIE